MGKRQFDVNHEKERKKEGRNGPCFCCSDQPGGFFVSGNVCWDSTKRRGVFARSIWAIWSFLAHHFENPGPEMSERNWEFCFIKGYLLSLVAPGWWLFFFFFLFPDCCLPEKETALCRLSSALADMKGMGDP